MKTYVKTTMYTPYWKVELRPAELSDCYHVYERHDDGTLTPCGMASTEDLVDYIFPSKL